MSEAQRGSITFLTVAALLPLIFVLFSLSLDLERYYTESNRLQKALDETALYAERFLPRVELARQAAQSYLARFKIAPTAAITQVGAHSISISVNAAHHLTFPGALGVDISLPLRVTSQAWSKPFDMLIALDSSSYLAPAAQVGGRAWGEESEWPSADFFRNFLPRYQAGVQIDPRLITQQCFNPVFSPLKLAAIRSYDYLAASALNSVGVLLFPAATGNIWELRRVGRTGDRGAQQGEADFDSLSHSAQAQDSWCAASFEQEFSTPGYNLPARAPGIPAAWEPGPESGRPSSMVVPGTSEYDTAYQPWLQTREALWSRAVQADRSADIAALLSAIEGELLGAASRGERKSMAERGTKGALILMGDLPRQGGVRFPASSVQTTMSEALLRFKTDLDASAQKARLYFVIAQHPELASDIGSQVEVLNQFFAALGLAEESAALNVSAVSAPNITELSGNVISQLLMERRGGVLAR